MNSQPNEIEKEKLTQKNQQEINYNNYNDFYQQRPIQNDNENLVDLDDDDELEEDSQIYPN